MKKNIAIGIAVILCSAALFFGCSKKAEETPLPSVMPSAAEETAVPESDTATEEGVAAIPEKMISEAVGLVSEIVTDNGFMIRVTGNGTMSMDDMYVNITDATFIAECDDGDAKKKEDIEQGDTVKAYVDGAMTKSSPPIANAYAVIIDVDDDLMGPVPSYIAVGEINFNEDGSAEILNTDEDMLITIPADMEIKLYGSEKTGHISDIVAGTKLLCWYDAVALSYPGQTTANNVTILE